MLAVFAFAFGAVGVADAGKGKVKRVKTKLVKVEIGPDGASGKVKSKKKACVKGRKVRLKGPKPFDPSAGRGTVRVVLPVESVKIVAVRTSAKGRWRALPPSDGFFVAGVYKVIVFGKRAHLKRGDLRCAAVAHVFKA